MRKITQTIVGTTPPLDKNVLWLDTTNSNEPVQKLFLDGEWKPLKDADVEAEFATGEKVSDISLVKASGASADNSKIATVAKLDETLSGYHERSDYFNIKPEKRDNIYVSSIDYCKDDNANYVVNLDGTGHDVDVIVLKKGNDDNTVDSVTTIRFKSTSTPTTLDYDDTALFWANEELPICEENAEYLIAIWNNIGVMTKVAPIPLEDSNS